MPVPHPVHFGKPGGVPQFGAEIAVTRNPRGIQFQGAAQGRHRRIGKPQGIRAIFADHIQRVDDIAKTFRHLLALGIADKAVQVDGFEGDFVCDGKLHHHHPSHPEKDDIRPGDQGGGGEIFGQFRGLFGPAKGANWPEAGGEPCVEDVGIAVDFCCWRINQGQVQIADIVDVDKFYRIFV